MLLRLRCWYYSRFLPPYVEGVLESRSRVLCRRLQVHIAACPRCRVAVADLATTHRHLREQARISRDADIWAQPPRASWRRVSLADRVAAQLSSAQRAARRRRTVARLWMVSAALAALLVAIAQPSPAREWLVRNFLHAPLAEFRAVRPAPGATTPPFHNPDPFQPQIALSSGPPTRPTSTSAYPSASNVTAAAEVAAPTASSSPPVPPLLPQSSPSPTAPRSAPPESWSSGQPAAQAMDSAVPARSPSGNSIRTAALPLAIPAICGKPEGDACSSSAVLFGRGRLQNVRLGILRAIAQDDEGDAMIVLAFDPGTATTGFAALQRVSGERLVPIEFGVIRTSPDLDPGARLLQIHAEVDRLIRVHQPESVATERLFFKNNQTTGIAVGRAIGVILLAVAQHALPWAEYTPMQVKKAVTGVGNAEKSQVQWMVTRLLGLSSVPKPDDAADALAVAICHAHCARASKIGIRSR